MWPHSFELPPTSIARPLPVTKSSKTKSVPETSTAAAARKKAKVKKRRRDADGFAEDDTPRAFARLMRFRATGRHPSGLDGGPPSKAIKNKKRKREEIDEALKDDQAINAPPKAATAEDAAAVPRIRPGERLGEFAARVDAALPVAGLIGKSGAGTDPAGLRSKQTKTERKMQRIEAQWRQEEQRRKELREEAEEEEMDEREMGTLGVVSRGKNKKKKKKKRGGNLAGGMEDDDDDEDDWAMPADSRVQKGLHDVVQAPPQLTAVPRARFKHLDGARVDVAEVPRLAGSLRKREELGAERKGIVEGYRALMEGRRKGALSA